ncbi:hypothetical protein NQ176_g11142 [Zarea fungicola]|uniref:Uncharacterized protein n=1 Tax=Zarea fungicola TaxID=93591 RepID=A0ACC1MCU6_9HYPO|nr:hypothetical protein NQ176_g11142 [Lecanicillium fungicola]
MLLPKGGLNWKGAKSQLPPSRAVWNIFARKRVIVLAAVVTGIVLLWRGIHKSASEMQKYVLPLCAVVHRPLTPPRTQLLLLGTCQITNGHVTE